jgi:hypothetical protein
MRHAHGLSRWQSNKCDFLFKKELFLNRDLFCTKRAFNPDFAVEIYYKKKMLQIQAFA